jgi:carbon storage regulator
MLILKRQSGESVWIGDNIQITVLGNVNGTTRIGITAPPNINIVREELHNREKTYAAIAKAY